MAFTHAINHINQVRNPGRLLQNRTTDKVLIITDSISCVARGARRRGPPFSSLKTLFFGDRPPRANEKGASHCLNPPSPEFLDGDVLSLNANHDLQA